MRKLALAAAAMAAMMTLGACDETMMTEGTPAAASVSSVARLQSLGYTAAATDSDGLVVALRYSGPVTAAVVCRQGSSGSFAPLSARQAVLDSYLILSGGRVTSGLYAVTLRNSTGQVEGIDFGLGESKAFSSGLVCKAS